MRAFKWFVFFVIIFNITLCFAKVKDDNGKSWEDVAESNINFLKEKHPELLGLPWGNIELKNKIIQEKLKAFFNNQYYVVIIQEDLHLDGNKEIVAVQKYKNRDYQITKAIIIEDNKAKKYPVLIKIGNDRIINGKNEILIDLAKRHDPTRWYEFSVIQYKERKKSRIRLHLVSKDGTDTSDDALIYWNPEEQKYYKFIPPF